MPFIFFWDWTFLIVVPAMIFAFWAQIKVQSTFSRFSRVPNRSGLTAAEAAKKLMEANGVFNVRIERVQGNLTDHYDPRAKVLRLSESVYGSSSVAAVGVACHEAGHAMQHANSYAPLKIRMAIIPICNFGSRLAMPLFLIGLILASASYYGDYLMLAGIACFSLAALFQLVTLPVEFNASRRAIVGMRNSFILREDELDSAKRVLSAAAMTYVAALATSLLSILRLLVIASRVRRR